MLNLECEEILLKLKSMANTDNVGGMVRFGINTHNAVHDKKADDLSFLPFFPFIKKGSVDGRNFVKKAVNWALRQIGKRNEFEKLGAQCAEDILMEHSRCSH
jgi:3-methyladenine DNA glycosylase AlkD